MIKNTRFAKARPVPAPSKNIHVSRSTLRTLTVLAKGFGVSVERYVQMLADQERASVDPLVWRSLMRQARESKPDRRFAAARSK